MLDMDGLADYLRSHGWVRTIELARYSGDRHERKVFRWHHPHANGDCSASEETSALASALETQIRLEGEIVALRSLLEAWLAEAGWVYRRDWGRVLDSHRFEREVHIFEWADPLADTDLDDEPIELDDFDHDEYGVAHLLDRLNRSGFRLDPGRTLQEGRLTGSVCKPGYATRTYFYLSALASAVAVELNRQGAGTNIYDG